MNRQKREFRTVPAILLMFLMLVMGTLTAEASNYTYKGVDYSPVFDYKFFSQKYPAINAAYGRNERRVFLYFAVYGTKKGLQGSSTFDVKSYAYRYKDVRKRFKNDLQKYYVHFCTVGYPVSHRKGVGTTKMQNYQTVYNGKDYASVYNYNTYISMRPSVEKAYGLDDAKVLAYFVKHDYSEVKSGGKTVSVLNQTMKLKVRNDLSIRVLKLSGNAGDAALVESSGKFLLIDTARNGHYDTILTKLRECGATTLDLYLSHFHDDHYGNLVRLLQNRSLKIGRLYLPEVEYLMDLDPQKCTDTTSRQKLLADKKAVRCILEAARSRGIRVIYLHQGSTFTFGRCKATVLWGGNHKTSLHDNTYFNNNSLVTKFCVRDDISFLSCGDASREAQLQLLNRGIDVKADIFALPHHGYSNGLLERFFQRVSPIYCYYTCYDSGFGENPDCTEAVRYAAKTSNVFSRSANGTIIFGANDGKIFAAASMNTTTVQADVKKNGMILRRNLIFNARQPNYYIKSRQTSA